MKAPYPYEISSVNDLDEWDELVERSPQGTIFSSSQYLCAAGVEFDLYVVRLRQQIKAGVVLITGKERKNTIFDDLVIYGGLLFDRDSRMLEAKRVTEEFQITEFVLAELDSRYDRLSFALSPHIRDMRPFLWFNYHGGGEHYLLDLKYTSYLDISSLAAEQNETLTENYAKLLPVRRQMIREARKKGAIFCGAASHELFMQYYAATLKNQGELHDQEKFGRIAHLVTRLKQVDKAEFYEVRNEHGEVLYTSVFCFDGKRAYYLFGAGNPKALEPYKGTVAIWDALADLARTRGVQQVDLEGVNSPNRGWFKLSFGGDLRPYYYAYK